MTRMLSQAGNPPDDRDIDALVQRAHAGLKRVMPWVRRPEAGVGVINSPLGHLLVAEGPRGLATLHFLDTMKVDPVLDVLRQRFDLVDNDAAAERVRRELERYLAGDLHSLDAHPIDLSLVHSEFQRRVFERLRKIGPGAVITYNALADAAGVPTAQRAVGHTMAINPVPIFVPCHRVIRSDGTVGNYGGGVPCKVKLLRTEGFEVGRDLRLGSRSVMAHRATHIFCRPGCSAAERANHARMMIFADPDCAERAGFRACRLCRPA
jgi:methylated-DNA-[protein]-cysteine S-methyltransferase